VGFGKPNLISPAFDGGYQGSVNVGISANSNYCLTAWFWVPAASRWYEVNDC